jgi:hypothetical protein
MEEQMKQNIGTTDRIIRIAAGLAIGALGLMYRNWLGLLALVPLLTAGIGVCPLYLPFGLSTVKKTTAAR